MPLGFDQFTFTFKYSARNVLYGQIVSTSTKKTCFAPVTSVLKAKKSSGCSYGLNTFQHVTSHLHIVYVNM